MKIDDSFKKPGSVPFKWEIRPGVPKLQTTQTQPGRHQFEPGYEYQHQRKQNQPPPAILKPPPSGLYFQPNVKPQTCTRGRSFQSWPRTLSDRFGLPGLARSNAVSSPGCFLSPIGNLKNTKKRGSTPEPGNYSHREISSWQSVSSGNSVFPLPSSFPYHRSSP